jgi:proline iminopeptidase
VPLEVNGVSLFTRRVGAGPLVVVLHGGPGAHHDYLLPQYDRLARGRELFYYDQRGGGRSPVPRETPVGWHEHVADLAGLREALGLERMTILGYSWGGLLAVLFLLEHPERVERLALVSPASLTVQYRREFDRRLAERANAPDIVRAREELRASGLRERDPAAYQRRAFELAVAGYFRDFADVQHLTAFRVTGRTQEAVWASLGEYDLRPRIGEVVSRFPNPASRVLHGTYDPVPIAGSRELAGLLRADFVELPTGHCPHVEATDEFVRTLDNFLPRS